MPQSMFVLFCFVLFCFVLFCFVLFCFVLFCFVLFCFVLFCFVLFCFVLFCFVLFYSILFYSILRVINARCRGGGAFLNDGKIRASPTQNLKGIHPPCLTSTISQIILVSFDIFLIIYYCCCRISHSTWIPIQPRGQCDQATP